MKLVGKKLTSLLTNPSMPSRYNIHIEYYFYKVPSIIRVNIYINFIFIF